VILAATSEDTSRLFKRRNEQGLQVQRDSRNKEREEENGHKA
jgi:hypothetical protein